MLKTRITKKDIEKGLEIVKNFGYWSKELANYLDQFEYFGARQRLNIKIKASMRG